MRNLDSQTKMIGRDNELKELQMYLKRASEGRGSIVFVSGEAGVGKTRLINEFMQFARSQNFQILSSNCVYESLTPYMPIQEAFRSGGLDYLLSDETPRVEAIYLMTQGGVLIKEIMRRETNLNPVIFSGMLTTVNDFVRDSLSMLIGDEKDGELNSLGYKNSRILIESGKNVDLVAIITGKENEFLINDMKEILEKISNKYGNKIEKWNGHCDNLIEIENLLKPIISAGKYNGLENFKDNPMNKRYRMFENILLGIIRYIKKCPTFLLIEDLHWADSSTLALLHYIGRNTTNHQLIIIGTYRPEDIIQHKEQKHPLNRTMDLMDHEGLIKKMELHRLRKEDISEFLESHLGNIKFSDESKDRIYHETEGNPLYIQECIKLMEEEKIIEQDNGTWKLNKDLKNIKIPSKIYNVIARRLSHLEEKERRVLDYASVVGDIFNSKLLAKSLKMKRLQLLEILRVLEQTFRLIHSENGNYKFNHTKIKEVAYSEIPKELRNEYHAIIASSIEKLNKDYLDNEIENLAFHYNNCQNQEKALHYLIKAAERAKKNYSNEETIKFYSEALKFEEKTQKRMEIFEMLGDTYELIGNFDKSISSYQNSLKQTKNKYKMAELKAKIGGIYRIKGDYNKSINICTEALNSVKGETRKEEAHILQNIGNIYHDKGEYDIAIEHWEKSLKIRQKINDLGGIAASLNNIGVVHLIRGEYDQALKYYSQSLTTSEKINNQNNTSSSLSNIGYLFYLMKEYDKALEYSERSLKIGKKYNLQLINILVHTILAEIYLKKRDQKNALKSNYVASELSKKLYFLLGIARSSRVFGKIYRAQNKWKKSIKNFEESIETLKITGMKLEMGESYYEFGLMWKAKGDIDKAKENLENAMDIFKKLHLDLKKANALEELESLKKMEI